MKRTQSRCALVVAHVLALNSILLCCVTCLCKSRDLHRPCFAFVTHPPSSSPNSYSATISPRSGFLAASSGVFAKLKYSKRSRSNIKDVETALNPCYYAYLSKPAVAICGRLTAMNWIPVMSMAFLQEIERHVYYGPSYRGYLTSLVTH